MPDQNVTNNQPGFFQRLKTRAWNALPDGMTRRIDAAGKWMSRRHLSPSGLLLGPAMSAYFAGSDLANGRSIGEVAAENIGFWGGNKAFTSLMNRLPNFKGKGAVTLVGSMVAGLPAAGIASSLAAKYAPIARVAPPTMEQYGAQLMQKTSARIACEYNYRRY